MRFAHRALRRWRDALRSAEPPSSFGCKLLLEHHLASRIEALRKPAISQVEPLRSRARVRAQLRDAMTRSCERPACGQDERLPDALALEGRIDEQAKMLPSRGSPAENPLMTPRSSQSECAICQCTSAAVTRLGSDRRFSRDRIANLHDSRNIGGGCAAEHRWPRPR
jgi:hypothetical protein